MRIEYISQNRNWGRIKDIASPGSILCRDKVDMFMMTDQEEWGHVMLINLSTGNLSGVKPDSEWQLLDDCTIEPGFITVADKPVRRARSGDIITFSDDASVLYIRSGAVDDDGSCRLFSLKDGSLKLAPGDTAVNIRGDADIKIWGPF